MPTKIGVKMDIKAVKLGRLEQKPIKLTQNQCYSPEIQKISKEDFDKFISLYTLTETEPKKVYNILTDFLKRHPILPEALSLMTYNYIQRRKVKRADETIAFNYKHNPDNLLAKINYADLCLRKGEIEEIKDIFEDQFDLRDLYPEKETFHFTEYRAFHVLAAHYYYDSGDKELAEGHLLLASNIDPKHPSVNFLAKKLYKKKKRGFFRAPSK